MIQNGSWQITHQMSSYNPYKFIVAVFLFGLIIITTSAYGEEIFTINTADKPPYSTESNNGIYDQIIQRMFKNIGMRIRINHLKSARSIEIFTPFSFAIFIAHIEASRRLPSN